MYEPYAINDEPSVPLGPETKDPVARVACESASGDIELQPILHCLKSLISEKFRLKRDAAEKNKLIAELGKRLRQASAESTRASLSQSEVPVRSAASASAASSTEIDLLRKHVETAEAAAVAMGKERDDLRTRANVRYSPPSMTFNAKLTCDCLLAQVRLLLDEVARCTKAPAFFMRTPCILLVSC